VSRSAISDGRILSLDTENVTFEWKDRSDGNRVKALTLSGVEFVRRYLRHVLPRGLRSIRYYGFCHPVAVRNRERIRMHTGMPIRIGEADAASSAATKNKSPDCTPCCPHCAIPMRFAGRLPRQIPPRVQSRAPPPAALLAV
ncbi:MAG TPA: transposase, partial [Chthoniobacterales bacterium]